MSDTDMVEAVAVAIRDATGCGLMRNGQRVFCDNCDCPDAARAALSAIEGRVRAEERERAARIAESRAEACRMAGVQAAIDPIEAQILDEHLSEAAAAIRSGDEG